MGNSYFEKLANLGITDRCVRTVTSQVIHILRWPWGGGIQTKGREVAAR